MAKDKYHDLVKQALVNEGWTITNDPLYLPTLKRTIHIDLGAERLIEAEKGNEKIAVEIKTFTGISEIHDFYKALGQFNYYQLALEEMEPNRVLFLAIPTDVYDTFFIEPLTIKAIARFNIKIIVYNVKNKTIDKWIN